MRLPAVLVAVAALLGGLAGSVRADVGSTPAAAARARTDRFARHEATSLRTTYSLGRCLVLHRRPWLAYRCEYTIHHRADHCRDYLTVAVKRRSDGRYEATAKTWYGSGVGGPC